MIVNDIQGNLFENLDPNGDAIAHGANCQGQMGAGVAKPIHDKYPTNFAVYEYLCENKLFYLGNCLVVKDSGDYIFNLATQFFPGADARYEAVADAAQKMYDKARKLGITKIKTVRIGAGIGGLEWPQVKTILEVAGEDDVVLDVYYF